MHGGDTAVMPQKLLAFYQHQNAVLLPTAQDGSQNGIFDRAEWHESRLPKVWVTQVVRNRVLNLIEMTVIFVLYSYDVLTM